MLVQRFPAWIWTALRKNADGEIALYGTIKQTPADTYNHLAEYEENASFLCDANSKGKMKDRIYKIFYIRAENDHTTY